MPEHPDVTLAVLAGGRATRMGGFPKGLLVVDGQTVMQRLLAFAPLFGDALISANDPLPYADLNVRMVPDLVPDRGAPGGLHAVLKAARTEWVLLVACDMPFVTRAAIDLLLGRRADGLDWLMFERGGRPEPLLGLYRARLGAGVEAALPSEPSMRKAVAHAPGQVIPEPVLREVDPLLRSLEGLNTPEEAQRAGALVSNVP